MVVKVARSGNPAFLYTISQNTIARFFITYHSCKTRANISSRVSVNTNGDRLTIYDSRSSRVFFVR